MKNESSDSGGSLLLLVFFLSLLIANTLPLVGPFLVASLFSFLKDSVLEEADMVVDPKRTVRTIVLAELAAFVGLGLFLVHISDLISFDNLVFWIAIGFVANTLAAYLGYCNRSMWHKLWTMIMHPKNTHSHGS